VASQPLNKALCGETQKRLAKRAACDPIALRELGLGNIVRQGARSAIGHQFPVKRLDLRRWRDVVDLVAPRWHASQLIALA
jgi:hypothetical protein